MNTVTTRVQQDGKRRRLFRRKFAVQVLAGPDSGRSITSAKEAVTVGSAPENDLVLRDAAVSRHHLRIEADAQGFLLSDLDSTNGTLIGRLRLRQVVVRDAVDLELGETRLRFLPLAEEEEIPLATGDRFGAVLGRSAAMLELFGQLQKVCRSDVTLLLEGETGTGKELVAQEVHRQSARRERPFSIVDCGAIPPGLIESEFFGHARGAFTNALHERPGVFEEAHGGTVFLDEIGELELALQPNLLRVLERGEVKRVGEAHYRPVDVRVIAATNRDLQRAVNQGSFRADLFYRLAVVRLRVPPLRQRPEDIELLVNELLPPIAQRLGAAVAPQLGAETLQQLIEHPWRGNVRELRNFLERLVALSGKQGALEPALELRLDHGAHTPSIEELESLPFKEAKNQWLAHFDVEYLRRLLLRCAGNVAEAARQSGVDRVHLFRLIKKYGLRE